MKRRRKPAEVEAPFGHIEPQFDDDKPAGWVLCGTAEDGTAVRVAVAAKDCWAVAANLHDQGPIHDPRYHAPPPTPPTLLGHTRAQWEALPLTDEELERVQAAFTGGRGAAMDNFG